jgi:sugar (pentulose or hexulose) kinase
MALNFTPLTAYRIEVMDGIRQRAENQRRMGEGLGAIFGAAKGAYDAQKTRDFFAQFDDSEELSAIDEQIKENEEQIEKLNAELEALGG